MMKLKDRIHITETNQHEVFFNYGGTNFVLNRWGVIGIVNTHNGQNFYQYQVTFGVQAEKELTEQLKVQQTWPKRYRNPMYWYK